MAKPWAKVQVGRMRHRKFLALNGNAIALWDEIKDYCDEHLTDGIVPLEAFKTFRFAGKKSISLLKASCGHKPDGTEYAPLLEPHALGFKMHDFLEHNDCRETVLKRMALAEQRKNEDRDRKKSARGAKAAKKSAAVSAQTSAKSPHGSPHGNPPEIRSISVPEEVRTPQPPSGGRSERDADGTSHGEPVPVACPLNVITDDRVAERAGGFLGRYVEIYAKARHGAHHHLKPARDFPVAIELVTDWPNVEYLCGMAELFLLNDSWKPKNIPGTVGQFRHMAPQCDAELRRARWTPPTSRRES